MPEPTPAIGATANPELERQVLRKVTWRLIPFMFLLYIVAFLDRVNVSFAELQMSTALQFDSAIYGLGAGIFFLGYFIFEVPSNLIMERTGARIWIARIMVTWGLISAAMMFVRGEWSFYILRFLLGVAEAGFFPGMILYLTYWYTRPERARAVAWFMTAVPLAGVIGNPISGYLLKMHGVGGLQGWQWLFLLEGLPAVALGGVVLLYLTDRPEVATWLTPEERNLLVTRLKNEQKYESHHDLNSLFQGLLNPRVLLLSLLYFSIVISSYGGVQFFLPQVIKAQGVTDEVDLGYATAVPNLAAAIGMVLIGMSSDHFGERRWHVAFSSLLGAAGLLACAHSRSVTGCLVALSAASIGMRGTLGPFWALSTSFLGGAAAAGGIALINSVGNLGGHFGPYIMGRLHKQTQSYEQGLTILAGMLVVAAFLTVCVRPRSVAVKEVPAG